MPLSPMGEATDRQRQVLAETGAADMFRAACCALRYSG
jgi:hypothetical protein